MAPAMFIKTIIICTCSYPLTTVSLITYSFVFQYTTNSFQGVIITDGSVSYAVFLYACSYMRWSGNAVIGWQASSSYYRNHPLSGASNAKQIACLNNATSYYNTVLFKLSSVSKLVIQIKYNIHSI